MQKNIKTLIFSLLVAIVFVAFDHLKPPSQGEGLGAMVIGLQLVLTVLILVPLIFGIIAFIYSKEKKLKEAALAFGISFAVLLVSMLFNGLWKNNQRNKIHPNDQIQSLPLDSPERKQPLK